MEKPVSASFYNLAIAIYPALKNPTYAKLFGHILFSTRLCEISGKPLISAKLLAKIEGKNYTHTYNARKFLDEFSKNVMKVEYSSWVFTDSLCRTVKSFDLHKDLLDAYIMELRTPKKQKCVLLSTGEIISYAVKARILKDIVVDAQEKIVKSDCTEAVEVAEYMNSISQNSFTSLLTENLDYAIENANKLEAVTKQYNLNLLNDIVNLVSKTVYAPSENGHTCRIFPVCSSIAQLSKNVRRQIFRGCYEIDIDHAHFSINSKLWGATLVEDYLKLGDIWKDLVNFIGGKDASFDDIKADLKKSVYAIFYGASIASVKKATTENLAKYNIKNAGKKLLEHCVIATIVKARDKQIEKINYDGGARDIFGNFIMLTDEVDAKSILAQVAQSVELIIMKSVVDVAKKSDDFKIVCWLHDGCTIKSNSSSIPEKLCKIIEEKSLEIGVPVTASVKSL